MFIEQRRGGLTGLGVVHPGGEVPAPAPTGRSYQEAFDAAHRACESVLGEEECRRMLGYIPFLCPPPAQRPMTSHPLFWLALGLLVSKVFF